MAFNVDLSAILQTLSEDNPSKLEAAVTAAGLTNKVLIVEQLGPAPITFDLAPLIISVASPRFLMLTASGDGVTLKFDGVASFTTKAVKTLVMEIPATPSGALDIELDVLGLAAQTVKVLVLGS